MSIDSFPKPGGAGSAPEQYTGMPDMPITWTGYSLALAGAEDAKFSVRGKRTETGAEEGIITVSKDGKTVEFPVEDTMLPLDWDEKTPNLTVDLEIAGRNNDQVKVQLGDGKSFNSETTVPLSTFDGILVYEPVPDDEDEG